MAGTLKLTDIAHSSGAGTITVDSLATLAISTGKLTVGGTSITSGSSNVDRKVADYTIVTGDVAGKSELVIPCNASGGNRVITLPAVAAVGVSTCIITVILDADSGATTNVQVKDSGGTEVWTGIQKGDFVRLVVSNSVWLVIDHQETYFEYRYLTADQGLAAYVFEKWEATTSITSIGNMYSAADVAIVAPADGFMYINSNFVPLDAASPRTSGGLKIGTSGSMVTIFHNPYTTTDGRHTGPEAYNGKNPVTSGQLVELWFQNQDDEVSTIKAGLTKTQYAFHFVRSY